MYNVKDNAEAKLQVWLSSLATTLVVELGNGMLFPDAPFIAVLNKRDSDWKITKSEKVEVTAKDGDQFTVNRGYEWTTPQDFNAWDFFSLFVLAKHIQELQEWVGASAKSKSIANEYSNESTYIVGSIVMYQWERYKCTTAVSTAENFNPSKWTKVTVQSNLSTIEGNVSWLQTNMDNILTNWIPTQVLTKKLLVWESFTSWAHLGYIPEQNEELATEPITLSWANTLTTYAYASWTSSNQISFYCSKSETWTTVSDIRVTIWSLTWTASFNDIQLTRWKVTVTLNWNITSSRWTLLTIQFSLVTTSADWTFTLYQDPYHPYPSWTTLTYLMVNDIGLYSWDGDTMYAHCNFPEVRNAKITWSSSRTPDTAHSNDWTNRTWWSSGTWRYWRLCRYTKNYHASDVKFRYARYLRIMVWSPAFETNVVYRMATDYARIWDTAIWTTGTATLSSTVTRIYTTSYTPTYSWYYHLADSWYCYPCFNDVVSKEWLKAKYLDAWKTYLVYVNGWVNWWSWSYSYWTVNIFQKCCWLWKMALYPMENKSSWEATFGLYGFVPNMPVEWRFIHDRIWDPYWSISVWWNWFFGTFWAWGDDSLSAVREWGKCASNSATSTRYSSWIYTSAEYNV